MEHALPAFEARLRSFVKAKQKTAWRFRGFFAPRSPLALAMRNVAVRALAVPFVANRLIGGSLRDDLALPDYVAMRSGSY
jgi:2-polyprenyl-6-methoxyphenol hydroxylase-like FAD-dependent oxidoreductase